MPESAMITAFLVGLLGGVHCLGMCGGIVAALSLGSNSNMQGRERGRFFRLQLSYNFGRILSYVVMGSLAGALGMIVTDLAGLQFLRTILQGFAILIMIALGLYLAGWWQGLIRIERLGSRLWKKIEPLGRSLIPVKNSSAAFALGLVWGWLPCGLVYSILIWSVTAGNPLNGGLYLLSFGLGTLPNLMLMGMFAGQFSRFSQKPLLRKIAGIFIIVLALGQLYLLFWPQ